jgi:hypothetical protein
MPMCVLWHFASIRGNATLGRFLSEADIDQAALPDRIDEYTL